MTTPPHLTGSRSGRSPLADSDQAYTPPTATDRPGDRSANELLADVEGELLSSIDFPLNSHISWWL